MKPLQLLARVCVLALLLSMGQAHALLINLELGPVGSVFSEPLKVNLPGPNAENVTVLFNDSKYLELDTQHARFYQNNWGGPASGGNFLADMEFGFLDEWGDVLLSEIVSNGIIATGSHGRSLLVTGPLAAYGMFFNTESIGPLNPGASIEFSVNGLVAAPTSVPEPATLALLGLGLAGIGIGARRRRPQA